MKLVGIQYILDRRKKEKKDRDSSGIVGVAANNCTKGDHILHGKKYNTGHGIQAITDEVCGEIRREPCEPEIQQKPLVHLLLESALGWKRGIPCLSVQTAAPSSKPAYGGGNEAHPGHAKTESNTGNGGALAPAPQARVHPLPGKPVPGHAQAGNVPAAKGQNALQGKAIRTDAVSGPACAGGCEGGAAQMPGKPGGAVVPVYGDRRIYAPSLSGRLPGAEHLFFR